MPSSGGKKCALDRKSTRLNSSHTIISYAVFCLEKRAGERGGGTGARRRLCAHARAAGHRALARRGSLTPSPPHPHHLPPRLPFRFFFLWAPPAPGVPPFPPPRLFAC